MAEIVSVKHVDNLIHNLSEVKKLVEIHITLTGTKAGNRSSVNVLNKSGVVLLVACWEAFIEEIAAAAFEYLLKNAKDHRTFGNKVLSIASKEIKESKDETKIWDLAGDGWKEILQKHKVVVLENYTGNLNTAKCEQIDNLFLNLIGFKAISNFWEWRGMPNLRARRKLDNIISLRGDIAHKVNSTKSVTKSNVIDYLIFVQYLAAITSNRVNSYIHEKTGKEAWNYVTFGNMY